MQDGYANWAVDVAEAFEAAGDDVRVVDTRSETEPDTVGSPLDDTACVSRVVVLAVDGSSVHLRINVFSERENLVDHLQRRSSLSDDWEAQLGYPPDQRRSPLADAELDVEGREAVDFYCSFGLDRCERFVLLRRSEPCHAALIDASLEAPRGGDRERIRDLLFEGLAVVAAGLEDVLQQVPCPSGADEFRAVEFTIKGAVSATTASEG